MIIQLQLCNGENLLSNEVVINCERFKTCEKATWGYAIDEQDGSTNDLQRSGDVYMINCFCKQLLYKHGNIELINQLLDKHGKVYWYHLFDKQGNVNSNDQLFKHGNINYNELIAYWMMEGYLGHVDCVEEAYQKGHDMFMDIAYKEIPTTEASEEEVLDSLSSESSYHRYRGFYGLTRHGLVTVFDEGEIPKLGELVLDNGVITTRQTDGQLSCSSLLLDGDQLNRQVLRYFNEDLKYLAYFNPPPSLLQLKLPTLKLSVLVLRGCTFLEEIDASIGEMTTLTVLEISGSTSIKHIPDFLFTKLTNLRSLNLSYLAIEALPEKSFSKLVNLCWLILRGCSRLTELPSTKRLPKLEVIDLYGATSLEKLSTTKLGQVQMLDLSHTRVTRVPLLFNFKDVKTDSTSAKKDVKTDYTFSKVTHLFLRNCCHICVCYVLRKMFSLKVLDLSGAVNLKRVYGIELLEALVVLDLSRTGLDSLPQYCLQKLNNLRELNLSETNISSIPCISHLSSLLRLTVKDCRLLKAPPKMEGLVNLEVLDISGCTSLKNVEEIPFRNLSSLNRLNLSNTNIEKLLTPQGASSSQHHEVHFLQHLEHLEVLGLSKTSVKEIPDISHLKSLKQLFLAGCSQLTALPDLKALTKLQVLDLSETKFGNESLDKVPRSIRRLLLKDCSMIKGSLSLASLTLLRELDLRGSSVTEFPYEIAEMAHLRCLRLPDKIDVTGVDWSMINHLPKEIVWDQQFKAFESAKIRSGSRNTHSMSVKPSSHADLFHLVDNQQLWEGYFKEFYFSVPPSGKVNKDPQIYIDGDELVFKGIKFPNIKLQGRSVEIHGFSSFPEEAKSAVKEAVNVALACNSFIVSLSDDCFHIMETMKVCCIRRCNNMKFVLQGENLVNLETLVLSNLLNLEAFCAENVPYLYIDSLKHIYVDCCPAFNKIFTASHLPKNLETLNIKFCDAIKIVCDENTSLCTLPELRNLNLFALPKLQHVGADLPSLQTLLINQCPKFRDLNRIMLFARNKLTWLTLESCLQLLHVFPPSMLPQNLQVLEIRSCRGLKTLFEDAGTSSSMTRPSLPKLRSLKLWNLLKLESIGGDFPRLETCQIHFCPLLLRSLWPQLKTSNSPDD